MAERMQRMEDKLDNVVTQVSSTDTKLLEWKDELKDSIKEAIEKNNDKRDLNIRQRITWIISLFIGIPSTLWAFFQLINFLAKR